MSDDAKEREPGGGEESADIRGTLFLTTLLLILIFGFWTMMYLTMLEL